MGMYMPSLQQPSAIILTALPVERKAVRAHLTNLRDYVLDGTGDVLDTGTFVSPNGSWQVAVMEVGPGNNAAGVMAERAINHVKPDVALFVGVAGGIKDVKLGDVVAATKVYGYESGKDAKTFQPRAELNRSSHAAEQRARSEAGREDWVRVIKGNAPSQIPSALVAPIAAGEKVVASTRSATYKFLRTTYSDAVAVEMEGRGFLEATSHHQDVVALVVRGISDLVDKKSHADGTGSQEVASRHAAAFAFHVLGNLYPVPEGERVQIADTPATPAITSPARMDPDFAYPHPLQANFTGRVKERNALTTWYMEKKVSIYVIEAIGGMGKSSVTWVWVLQDLLGVKTFTQSVCPVDEANRPDGVLWWSFYEGSARFAQFLDRAIAYSSGGTIEPREIASEHDKVDRLLELLGQRNILLVLDGFEREFRGYASLNAAYQGDDVGEDVPADHRVCADRHADRFLRDAASLPLQGRVLMTTRLIPRELEGDDGNLLTGCTKNKLDGFDPADAVTFFQATGIKGTRAEIEAACTPYDYHPLALRLLAGMVANDKRNPGDIQVAKQHPVTERLKGRAKHHILQVSYDALELKLRGLLSKIAAFRNATRYSTLKLFNPYGTKEDRFESALNQLIDRGLLLFNNGLYDFHPIVRQYAYDRLKEKDKKEVHTRLRDHFSTVPMPEDTKKVERIEDLDPVIELYHHTVRAGQFDQARELFGYRFTAVLYYRFGAYERCIELLSALFPDSEPVTSDGRVNVPRLKNERTQSWTLNELANSYSLSGQTRRAGLLFERSNQLDEKAGDKKNLAIGLGNLAQGPQMPLGRLATAEDNLRRSIDLCQESKDAFWEAVGHAELGRLLVYQGAFSQSEEELKAAGQALKQQSQTQYEGVTWSYLALRAVLTGDAQAALPLAHEALDLWHKTAKEMHSVECDLVRMEWLLGWALTVLAGEQSNDNPEALAEAEQHLTEALTRCRKINMVYLEPDILLAWGRWYLVKGDAALAKEAAKEALSIADRCEYRLCQADIHNFLARLALRDGDRETARREADIGKERAWCDGPPHCYKPALDEAEAILAELG